MSQQVSVIGAGSFGTVISDVIAQNGYGVSLWSNSTDVVNSINTTRKNIKYQPNLLLHSNIVATNSLEDCFKNKIIFFALPSKYATPVVERMSTMVNKNHIVVSLVKGFLDSDEFFFSSFLSKNLHLDEGNIIVLSGPNLSAEISEGKLTATIVAGTNQTYVDEVVSVLANDWFLIEKSTDVQGTQFGGGVKNIYAIASGIIHSKDYGNNCFSLLFTRSVNEILLLAKAIGANADTIIGISGLGDLLTTCTSSLSRNYRLGVLLGRGFNTSESLGLLSGESEGFKATHMVYRKAGSLGLDLPILTSIYRILYEGQASSILLDALRR